MEGKNLVIVESPEKAKTIQKFLGDDYVVKASKGHIRDLYDNTLSIDIENNFKPEYVIPADKKKLVSELKKDAKAAQTVWLASDEDREGEAISWHLFEALGLNPENTRRIAFHEITKNAIQNAIQNPRSIDMDLVNAQQARRILDRLVGFELSPVLWHKIQRNLSAGRVQSVTLRLVVDREREIINFKREPYYRIEAHFHPAALPEKTLVKGVLDKKFSTADQARHFLEQCIGAEFSVSSLEQKEGVRYPAAPFTTSTLQQEASRKLRISVSQTMSIAQKLYESGLITYMRTDSTNLSSEAIGAAKGFICDNFGPEYHHARQFKTTSKGAQEAHEAIRPTFIGRTAIQGTAQEQKLYDLIWKRTVASQMSDAKILKTEVKIGTDRFSEKFSLQAQQVLFDGFLKVYLEGSDDETEEDEVLLPALKTGDIMEAKGINAECKFTTPPPRYSQATLIKKMEELGIGRPSTYAPTITTLTKARGYITIGNKEGEKKQVTNLSLDGDTISAIEKTEIVGAEKGKLIPQEIGVRVSDYLVSNFDNILDYSFTANVEKDFDRIADGDADGVSVIREFYGPFHKKVDTAIQDRNYNKISRELGVDPSDGQTIVARYGQFGPYIQKGEGDHKVSASLGPGQLIESITLEEALKLLSLPRIVGQYEGIDIIATKGRFGPYLKYGSKNVSLPKGANPVSVDLDTCIKLITQVEQKPADEIIAEWPDVKIINGRYGPYIKSNGSNYKIPKGSEPSQMTLEDCKKIIEEGPAPKRRYKKS